MVSLSPPPRGLFGPIWRCSSLSRELFSLYRKHNNGHKRSSSPADWTSTRGKRETRGRKLFPWLELHSLVEEDAQEEEEGDSWGLVKYFYRHFIPIKGFATNCVLLSLPRTVTSIALGGGEKEDERQRSCCGIPGTTRGSGGGRRRRNARRAPTSIWFL